MLKIHWPLLIWRPLDIFVAGMIGPNARGQSLILAFLGMLVSKSDEARARFTIRSVTQGLLMSCGRI